MCTVPACSALYAPVCMPTGGHCVALQFCVLQSGMVYGHGLQDYHVNLNILNIIFVCKA